MFNLQDYVSKQENISAEMIYALVACQDHIKFEDIDLATKLLKQSSTGNVAKQILRLKQAKWWNENSLDTCDSIINSYGDVALTIAKSYRFKWWKHDAKTTCFLIRNSIGDKAKALFIALIDGWIDVEFEEACEEIKDSEGDAASCIANCILLNSWHEDEITAMNNIQVSSGNRAIALSLMFKNQLGNINTQAERLRCIMKSPGDVSTAMIRLVMNNLINMDNDLLTHIVNESYGNKARAVSQLVKYNKWDKEVGGDPLRLILNDNTGGDVPMAIVDSIQNNWWDRDINLKDELLKRIDYRHGVQAWKLAKKHNWF